MNRILTYYRSDFQILQTLIGRDRVSEMINAPGIGKIFFVETLQKRQGGGSEIGHFSSFQAKIHIFVKMPALNVAKRKRFHNVMHNADMNGGGEKAFKSNDACKS